jgi:hypothetical protein
MTGSNPTSDGNGWSITCEAPSYNNNYGYGRRDEANVYAICLYSSYEETKSYY